MAQDNGKALDLDELFGQNKSIKVKWHDKQYELIPISAIGPKDALALQKMQARATAFSSQKEEITDETAAELERMFDEMLVILSRELPLEQIPFGAKMKILEFYTQESEGKKKALPNIKPTGARSSRK